MISKIYLVLIDIFLFCTVGTRRRCESCRRGSSQAWNEITGTICGTSIYLAPEVFENRIYNSKADMYSFGYVLWELWYGETAFGTAVINSRTKYKVLEDVVKRDLRPTHIEGTQHPWGNWQHVMASCWNKDPKLRLTALKGWEQLQNPEDFQENIRPPSPPHHLWSLHHYHHHHYLRGLHRND